MSIHWHAKEKTGEWYDLIKHQGIASYDLFMVLQEGNIQRDRVVKYHVEFVSTKRANDNGLRSRAK